MTIQTSHSDNIYTRNETRIEGSGQKLIVLMIFKLGLYDTKGGNADTKISFDFIAKSE